MIALQVMTDGRRDYIERTIPSFLEALDRPDLVSELRIHDDSGDVDYRHFLEDRFAPLGFKIYSSAGRSGFGGAIRSAWNALRVESEAEFVFHLEDDFVPKRTVEISKMVRVLLVDRGIAQVALRRQPWNDAERAAGGIVEQHPEDFVEVERDGLVWLEHGRFFTTNPTLYRMALVFETEWPDGRESEGRYGIDLLRRGYRFAYYGSRDSGEAVEHIGNERVGTGY